MPRLRLLAEPELLNSAGNIVHVTGIAWAGRYREPAETATDVEIPYASGAAFAIHAALFRQLGGFTRELFMYQEDLELGWKVRMRGLRVVLVPSADVLHEYDFARHEFKHYLLERNRLVFLLSAYSGRMLGLLAPLLVSTELGMAALALREGWLRDKARGWAWLARNARWVVRHRRETQRLRRVPDRDLARFLTPVLDPAMLELPAAVRVVNPLVSAYWSLARRLL
jgi:GT2 family glycosyltransferase